MDNTEIQTIPESVSRSGITSAETHSKPKLDLSGLEPPRNLMEARVEEITIDGICGVY